MRLVAPGLIQFMEGFGSVVRSTPLSRIRSSITSSARRYTSIFDPVQPPSARHALELVNAAFPEEDSSLLHPVLDRARDQDFAGTRFRSDARADVKRETDHLGTAHLVFARMQPHPDLEPQRAHGLANRGRATDAGSRRLERREAALEPADRPGRGPGTRPAGR